MSIKSDYHVHPDYSYDAERSTINDYCQKALKLGLNEICFTPHYTIVPSVINKFGFVRLNGEKTSVLSNWLENYLNEIKIANEYYNKKGLYIFSGLEVDYCDLIYEDLKKKLILDNQFDYLLGSVHLIGELDIMIPKEAEQIFTTYSPSEFYEIYFNELNKIIDSGLFKAIAHIEGYKRYAPNYNLEYTKTSEHLLKHFEKLFNKLLKQNMLFEINLSLFRDGHNTTNPSENILKLAYDCGIRYVTIGSDAHKINDLAFEIDQALSICKKIGLNIYSLTNNF